MAKRTNPFIEDYVPQSKVHVGDKQFNNNEDRLKKVYEKTLQLLFRGAKKVPEHDILNNLDLNDNKKDKMKQLFIGKDGSLLHSGNMVQHVSAKQCSCGGAVETKCAYCEESLCNVCQHNCERCGYYYCSHCSLNGSDGSEVCVSCYG